MSGGYRIIGIVSVMLLICVLIGQAIWFYKVREIKQDEFRHTATFVLRETLNSFLDQETLSKEYRFGCGLANDGKTFRWSDNKSIQITSSEMFYEILRNVFYDHLYQNQYLNLAKIDSMYRTELYKKGIGEKFVFIVWDKDSGESLICTDTMSTYRGRIFTQPVDVGYEHKHQVVAGFPEPWLFHSLGRHLMWEGAFMLGFVISLVWQWRSIRTTWQSAKVQTLGMAHLEHELRKPLATMISMLDGILTDNKRELTDMKIRKLGMMKARLLKMSDVTDTMLATMKTARLEIEREPLNIREEMEQVAEMFEVIRSHAKVNFRIEESLKYPLLDKVYFNYLVINLVDNGIKYAGKNPVIHVEIREEQSEYVLVVSDNGMGMPKKVLRRIFGQFYRVKDERVTRLSGFGLGLAFVRKVVTAYGGRIKVESEVGVGSCFTIFIPSHQKNEIEL